MTDMADMAGSRPAGLYACVLMTQARHVADDSSAAACELTELAHEFSPRIEVHGPGIVALDVEGLARLYGDARAIGKALHRAAAVRHMHAHVAIAATRATAVLTASACLGVTVVAAGVEAEALASLPLDALEWFYGVGTTGGPGGRGRSRRRASGRRHYRLAPSPESRRDDPLATDRMSGSGTQATSTSADGMAALHACGTVRRWGLKTLGDLASLPSDDLFERLGLVGVALQRLARGEDLRPLVPDPGTPRFMHSLALEWPIEGVEPLAFALGRVLDPLCRRLERHDRGVAVLHLKLRLVTRQMHVRRLEIPTPLRDLGVLRTLILLDLESHPPPAGIDDIAIVIEPAPGPILQFSLLERARPVPEQLSTLLARLQALMGEGRCGMPVVLDTHRPDGVTVGPFSGDERSQAPSITTSELAASRVGVRGGQAVWRRFRVPLEIHVRTIRGRPVAVRMHRNRGGSSGGSSGGGGDSGGSGGTVVTHAGPWRTSGEWWRDRDEPGLQGGWDRDEWDVALTDGGVYRIHRNRDVNRWFLEGLVD